MRSSMLARVAPLAIFLAALIANRRAATSPIVWSDTIYDQSHVGRCLAESRCTLLGTQTSVRGLFHAVAWLELRTLLHWLGLGPNALLWLAQVLNALAAAIVFQLCALLGGLLAGAVAAAVLVFGIDLGFPLDGVHNLSALPFLGAVLTVACTAVVYAPGFATVVLAALVAAVMANVHIICVLTGVSVAWSALAAPRRRFLLAAVAVAAFSAATIGFAPPSWQQNLLSLLGGDRGGHATLAPVWPRMEVAWWTLLAVAIWVASLRTRAPAWVTGRRAAIAALAIVIPMLTTVMLAPAVGIYTEAKYLIPVHAACATAAGLAIGLLVQSVLAAALPPALCRAVALVSPFAAGLAIAMGATLAVEHQEQTMAIDDLMAAAHVLRADQGWDDRHVVRGFSTPERANALTGLLQQNTGAPGRPASDVTHDIATLIKMREGELPDPLPRTWHVLRRSSSATTVLVVDRAQLDWRRFELCAPGPGGSAELCNPVTWDGFDPLADAVNALPRMPPAGVRWTGAFRLRIPVLPDVDHEGGAIFMPRGFVCGGHIAAVRGIAGTIDHDRRRLTFAGAPDAAAATVDLEWNVGSPECSVVEYDGLPPFIIEGRSTDVDRLEEVFRRREDGESTAGAS